MLFEPGTITDYLLRCPFDRREVQNLENAMTLAPGPFVTLGTDRGYVQRRMRLLQRARKDRQLVDLGEASRVAQVFRLPGRANNFYAFFEPHSAFVLLNTKAIVFEPEESAANAKLEPSAG